MESRYNTITCALHITLVAMIWTEIPMPVLNEAIAINLKIDHPYI